MIREFAGADIVYLLAAARWTVLLALTAMVGGGLLGVVVAVLRVVPFKPLNWLAIGYINLIQGTPLLGQLFVFFFGLPLVGLSVDAWTAAALSLSIYASAFFGEIWRGSLQSVSQRQWEAGAALGLTYCAAPRPCRPAPGHPHQHRADRRLPGPAGEEHLAHRADRLRRTDAGQPDHQRRDLRAAAGLSHRRRHLLRHLLFPLPARPHAGKETSCRSLSSPTSASASARSRC